MQLFLSILNVVGVAALVYIAVFYFREMEDHKKVMKDHRDQKEQIDDLIIWVKSLEIVKDKLFENIEKTNREIEVRKNAEYDLRIVIGGLSSKINASLNDFQVQLTAAEASNDELAGVVATLIPQVAAKKARPKRKKVSKK